jgi:hypothetical protein
VKVLLSHGGSFEQVKSSSTTSSSSFSSSAGWQYVGGETRLVAVQKANQIGDFVQQLSKATAAVWDEVRLAGEGVGGGGGVWSGGGVYRRERISEGEALSERRGSSSFGRCVRVKGAVELEGSLLGQWVIGAQHH